MNAKRPSLVTTAQQISLRPFPSERVAGSTARLPSLYDEAAALPFSARNASVTTSVPSLVKAKPYGVGPDEGWTNGSSSRPSGSTGKAAIASAPRSVTTSVEPSGLNPTWAGSASAASEAARAGDRLESARDEAEAGQGRVAGVEDVDELAVHRNAARRGPA